MENLSKKDINLRLANIKQKAKKITEKIDKNNKAFESRYDFAKTIGVKVEDLNKTTDKAVEGLNNFISKADIIMNKYTNDNQDEKEEQEENEEIKILNNILYLDDIKLKNISELVNENNDLKTKEYLKLITLKANDLIREEELKDIDSNIAKLSRITVIDKLTGKARIKRAMRENYSLKRVQTINKKYIPEDKSLYEIVSITNNCGYKSKNIDFFVSNIVKEFELDSPQSNSLIEIDKEQKLPFFFSRQFLDKINAENTKLLDMINDKKAVKNKTSEFDMFNEMLLKDVDTLELLKYDGIKTEEVI